MKIPQHKNRQPDEIINKLNEYDSSGRIYKAISWLDYACNHNSVSSLEYAALETRLGIEQLLFETLIVSVGSPLDNKQYKRCSGNAKKLDTIINKLIPKYQKLVAFSQILAPQSIPLTIWDNKKLIVYSGKVSRYLHWSGGLDETVQSKQWFNDGVETVSDATCYIWSKLTTGNTGVMIIEKMQPELKSLWEKYKVGEISLDSAKKQAEILEPILQARFKTERSEN